MTVETNRATPKDTKADEVCNNKWPNKKKHTHNRMIQNNAIIKTTELGKIQIAQSFSEVTTLGARTICDGNEFQLLFITLF